MTDEYQPNLEITKPSAARMYDYALGGYHNYAIDRQAFEQVLAINPDVVLIARANRAFLRRAVTFLLDQGIDQFLDIGSGIPTVGNVHEIVQAVHPEAPVVYVDIDPLAVAHSNLVLKGNPRACAIQADVRRPEHIIQHPDVLRLLDFARPIGLLLVTVLHYMLDDATASAATRYLYHSLIPGSYVAISHVTNEGTAGVQAEQIRQVMAQSTNPTGVRSRAQIQQLLDGLDLVPPGLVWLPEWRPESADDVLLNQPERSSALAAVGQRVREP